MFATAQLVGIERAAEMLRTCRPISSEKALAFGLIREEVGQGAEPFNELWHLVKPLDAGREWAIAGITPLQAA